MNTATPFLRQMLYLGMTLLGVTLLYLFASGIVIGLNSMLGGVTSNGSDTIGIGIRWAAFGVGLGATTVIVWISIIVLFWSN